MHSLTERLFITNLLFLDIPTFFFILTYNEADFDTVQYVLCQTHEFTLQSNRFYKYKIMLQN